MIGITSKSAGVLLLSKSESADYTVFDVALGEEKEPIESQYLYSAVQDWEEIEASNETEILDIATKEYWLTRVVSLLREAIGGLESELEKCVLEYVEELLGSRVSSEMSLNRLLIAPLKHPQSSTVLAKTALSFGFTATASILDELVDLQPLLRRLTELWLSLSETVFSRFSESKDFVWLTVVEKGDMKQLLNAANRNGFTKKWNLLAYHFTAPQSRRGVNDLGQILSQQLFPQELSREEMISITPVDKSDYKVEQEISDYEVYTRVKKQISAIAQAVSQGQDRNAEKFLRELIREQTSSIGGETYAVMSLCNIAKRCADMFRMDFEIICLNKALQLNPSDSRSLIQYGDHLKRMRNYDKALEFFNKVKHLGQNDVAISSVADVYTHQGDYIKAIDTYKTIPDWEENPTVLTAIADTLRKMGRFDEARDAYVSLIASARQGRLEFAKSEIRAGIGLAEIAKKLGNYKEAFNIYDKTLQRNDVAESDSIIYKLGLCNVLKLMEKFDDAFSIVDEVVREYPFAMQARFTRGSILGLIGKEQDGLADLPESHAAQSWREWLRRYYRGLLLLKLKRYEEAKVNLVDELPKAIASGEEKTILRMAAALYFLNESEIPEAEGVLSSINKYHLYDCQTQYLLLIFKLHIATLNEDAERISHLTSEIASIRVVDGGLQKALKALQEKDYCTALIYETQALLKLAA